VPLPALLVLGTLAAAMPWWRHRRRRARVRIERTLEAWPDIAEAVGLTGSRVMSAVVDLWGWRARIGLRRGQTAADVIAKVSALESGLGARPGAVRVEPDPARADHCLIRVLNADPHARAIAWPATTSNAEPRTITAPIPLGLFEDASPVAVTLAHRHALIGGIAGAGKSGILNAILASLTGCPDVVLWGVDLKGGMELGPWAPCLDRLATTPAQAAELLADAVAILDSRAARLADAGQRLWQPSPAQPALVVIIDEYAELSDDAPTAVSHADSTARRGRAVAVTLLVATQRPTQKAMGSGAVRSQMDVRVCLRVRERRDVDLVLGQGMLAAGWHAHTLDAPGKFLISAPEHTTPRRARAYLLTDTDVTTLATRQAPTRPALDDASRAAAASTPGPSADDQQAAVPRPRQSSETVGEPGPADGDDPDTALLCALRQAPPGGASVPDLMTATGMGRTWVYDRLQDHATDGRAVQVSRGRWRANHPEP
jgi:DNA segregation ATPase FtsK/SpoIIIE, S-DNA-T family